MAYNWRIFFLLDSNLRVVILPYVLNPLIIWYYCVIICFFVANSPSPIFSILWYFVQVFLVIFD